MLGWRDEYDVVLPLPRCQRSGAREFWAGPCGSSTSRATTPTIPGRDRSRGTVDGARARARAQGTKNRVHFDLRVPRSTEVTDLGATVVLPAETVRVPLDGAGGPGGQRVLCVPPRRPAGQPPLRRGRRLRRPRGDRGLVGGPVSASRPTRDGEDWGIDKVPGMPFENLVFVPGARAEDGEEPDPLGRPRRRRRARARRRRRCSAERSRWVVMADPEGNEFCVFPPD